jgi:ABC-type bacteriocin/lantibiotic exporter with double-glycine peptidase domain
MSNPPRWPVVLACSGIALGLFGELAVKATAPKPTASSTPRTLRSSDCGAYSLNVICRLANVESTLDDMRTRLRTSATGNSMLEIKTCAESYGLAAKGCHCSFDQLHDQVFSHGNLAICHSTAGHFFAIVDAFAEQKLLVADVGLGVFEVGQDELSSQLNWEGDVLLLRRQD